MKLTILAFIILATTATAVAQELLNQPPLEIGRPSEQPIQIERKPLPAQELTPPPKRLVRKRRKVKATAVSQEDPAPAAPVKKRRVVRRVRKKKPLEADPVAASSSTSTTPPASAPTAPPQVYVAPRAYPATRVPPASQITGPSIVITRAAPPRVAPVTAVETRAASTPNQTRVKRKSPLFNFRFANIWAVRNRTNSGSFILNWDPVFFTTERFNFGISVGATQFESETITGRGADSFWVYEYGVASSYFVTRRFLPELFVGVQQWNEDGDASSNMLIAVNANVLLQHRPLGILDRFYVGFGALSMSDGFTNIYRAGFGVRF